MCVSGSRILLASLTCYVPRFPAKPGRTQLGGDHGDVQLRGCSPGTHRLPGTADGEPTASSAELSNLHLATAH